MKSGKAKNAAHQALYLSAQSIKVEQVDRNLLKLGQAIVASDLPYEAAHDRLLQSLQAPLEAQLNQQAAGLHIAAEANGWPAIAKGIQHLTQTWDEPQDFYAQTERLKVAAKVEGQPDYVAAISQLEVTYRRINELDDVVTAKLGYAIDRAVRADVSRETRVSTTEWRQDTAPELARLLKINPEHEPRFQQLTHVMEARSADGQHIPGKRYYLPGTERSFGVPYGSAWTEVLFAASKSVSVAYALASTPEEKGQILDAHRRAVHHSLSTIVAPAIGVDRSDPPQPAHITWVLFHHATARATPGHMPDPHLHTHAVIPNVTLAQTTGKVGSLVGYNLKNSAASIDYTYRVALTSELQRIGMDARHIPETHDIKLGHITPEMEAQFSKRSNYSLAKTKAYLAKQGQSFDQLSPRQQAAAVHKTALLTRKVEHGYQNAKLEHLQANWQRQAKSKGWAQKPQITRTHKYRMEPWMAQSSDLSGEYLASAQRSYARWKKDNPEWGNKYSFAEYVIYVQERWHSNPEMFDEKGGREIHKGKNRSIAPIRGWGVEVGGQWQVQRPEL